MSTAVFGDFLDRAEWHIQAAAGSRDVAVDPAAAPSLLRLVTGMARHLDDRVPLYADGVIATADLRPWDRAIADSGAALHRAAENVTQGMAAARMTGRQPAGELGRFLDLAATSLTAGRDLLHTHLTTTPGGLQEGRSEWALVVTSPTVTRAVTDTVARWSAQLAVVAARMATGSDTGAAELAEMLEGLRVATQWLCLADAAVRPARAADPATRDDIRLLRAIPTAYTPPRRPTGQYESVRELSLGVTASAQRLRARAFGAMAQAQWMAPSADTWQWSANAAAVTGHASALILRSLASHPSSLGSQSDGTLLSTAGEAMARSWRAWRQAAAAWPGISTETRGRTAPIVTDIGDLMLRIGRLAWDDPNWTPARPHRAGQRTWADRTAGIRAAVVAAVHQASDAFAQLAAADLDVVTAADRAGRLYVRTRELSADYDVPRPYATAPVARTRPLLEAYRAAGHASRQAAGMLAALALTIDAPSAPLALARAAAESHHSQATHTSQHPSTRIAIPLQPRVPAVTPGPTEQAIRNMRVTDPAVLVRATVIDNASRQLISQASHLAGPRPVAGTTGQRQALGHAAQLAAQDSPNAPATNATKTGQITRLPRSATPTRRPVTPQRPRPRRGTRPGSGQNSARRRTG